jgi:mono/diheme cytochrome c family protein
VLRTVKHKALLLAAGALASGLFVLTGQQPAPSGVFTQAQAEAGRRAYENTCGKCHTPTLLGRKGDPGELPPVNSLPAYMQEMASGLVPGLAGADFMERWGSRTTAELTERINQAVGAFPPEGTHIPVPGHAPAESDPTAVNITAWVLQANGARAGTVPLTRTTEIVVRSITARPVTEVRRGKQMHIKRIDIN